MTYMISYDLRQPGRNYDEVYKTIESASNGQWCRPLESVYIISSNLSSDEIHKRISAHIDSGDRFIVAEITKQISWYLDAQISDYLETLV